MKWKKYAPKIQWGVSILLCILGIAAVMRKGVIVAQSAQAGVGVTVEPLNAIIAAAVMALIGIQIVVFRRHHIK